MINFKLGILEPNSIELFGFNCLCKMFINNVDILRTANELVLAFILKCVCLWRVELITSFAALLGDVGIMFLEQDRLCILLQKLCTHARRLHKH